MKQQMSKIYYSAIKQCCPLGNENDRNRALQLLKSGSLMIKLLQHINCKPHTDYHLSVFILKTSIVSSVKTKALNSTVDSDAEKLHKHQTACLSFDFIDEIELAYSRIECG